MSEYDLDLFKKKRVVSRQLRDIDHKEYIKNTEKSINNDHKKILEFI